MAKRIPGRSYYANGRIKPLARDYRAEELRRNAKAASRGHGTRAKQRGKIERGLIAPLQPKRVSSAKTIKAQDERRAKIGTGFKSRSASEADRELCWDWSAMFAQTLSAEYHPEIARSLGVTRYEYTKRYLACFVDGPGRYKDHRRRSVKPNAPASGGSEDMRYWFVTLNDFYDTAEYDRRYAI